MRARIRAVGCVLMLAGCQSEGGGEDPSQTFDQALVACGLATSGTLPPDWVKPSAFGDCVTNCWATSGTCEQLGSLACGPTTTSEAQELLTQCNTACLSAFGHTCGDGEQIGPSFVCDGGPQCADGSDEANCEPFECGDATTILPAQVCDGISQCETGLDEANCPRWYFTCNDGARLPWTSRCDGVVECDGSDELGCAELLCG